MPRRVTPEIPLTPEQQEAQESGQALFDQTIEEQAFLCYLQQRLAEMERFIGNPAELVERDRYEWVGGPEYLACLESRVSFAPQFVWEFPTHGQYKAWLAEHWAIAAELAASNELVCKEWKEESRRNAARERFSGGYGSHFQKLASATKSSSVSTSRT